MLGAARHTMDRKSAKRNVGKNLMLIYYQLNSSSGSEGNLLTSISTEFSRELIANPASEIKHSLKT
jgi:hypothetical protein